jgi:subtilase family serine protease
MDRMLLVLKRSPGQEAALRKLLDDQQDRNSPSYHKWMTPEQYGEQFGPSDADMQTITSWLQSHGFQVGTTKGRTVLEFSGSASQVEEAFHSTIHKYLVNGEQHWANANDPQIPSALAPAVAGVLTLHNFIKKPASHLVPQPAAAKLRTGKKPEVSFPQNGGVTNALSPADFRTIYGMNNLTIPGYSVIAVVGRSNLYNGGQDVGNFQSVFGGGNFSIIVNGPDPGDLGGGEEAEATLDSSWSMGLAPVATVNLVVSSTTDTTDGIDLSEVYIIEHNLAPIMTESFSGCELFATDTQLAGQSALAEQAAAQGITYIVSTGDSGAAGCDDPNFPPAIYPISVNFLASTAFNVAVGGTMFNENGNPSKYWASSPPISETALSYIPENVWNESSSTGLWAGSGGASAGNIASGLGTTSGVPKPNWQYGVPGIPADSVRDLPDVSLSAAGHDPYLLCLEGSCVPDSTGSIYVYFISGTSASAPSFAAIMAYLDDLNARTTGYGRMGLANYILYRLGATLATYPSKCNGSNTAAAPESDCVFYDVTTGNNVVPGETGALYQAGVGYDLTTGLGSVNVLNLLAEWESVHFNPTTTGITFGASTVTHGSPVPFTITVMPSSGTGVPTGDTFLEVQGSFGFTPEPTGIGPFPLSGGTVSSTTTALPGGTYNVVADYAGDTTYAPSASALSSALNVTPEASTTTVSVLTADQNGQPIPFTSGPFGSFVYLRADVAGQSGQGFATGSVTFTDSFGTIPGGSTFALNGQGNTATPNGVFSFDTGTHTISASYGGDGSFNASSSGQPQTFTIAPGFFAAVGQSTVVVTAPGGTGQTSISISNSTGFSGTISLACSGLPSEAKCLFSPTSVTVNGTAGTTMASIAVTTAAATAGLRPNLRLYLPAQLVSIGLFAFVLLACPKRQRVRGLVLLSMMTLLLLVPACGGSGGGGSKNPPPNLGTPAGTSNVTVTATSGSTVSSTGFTLVIQ